MKECQQKGHVSSWKYGVAAIGLSVLLSACATSPSTVPAKRTMAGSLASNDGRVRVAIVDPQAVFDRSKAGQRVQSGLRELIASQQDIVSREEQELKELERQMQDKASGLTDAQRQEKRQMLGTKVQQHQRYVKQVNQEVATRQRELVAEYMQKIRSSIQTVAEAMGIGMVIHKGSESNVLVVLYHNADVDLTDAVLQEFDRQFN